MATRVSRHTPTALRTSRPGASRLSHRLTTRRNRPRTRQRGFVCAGSPTMNAYWLDRYLSELTHRTAIRGAGRAPCGSWACLLLGAIGRWTAQRSPVQMKLRSRGAHALDGLFARATAILAAHALRSDSRPPPSRSESRRTREPSRCAEAVLRNRPFANSDPSCRDSAVPARVAHAYPPQRPMQLGCRAGSHRGR
jgi:hypothetical protein